LLVGLDRPQAQNRLDAPMIIGLGKAYYQLEHDNGLRVAVLHGMGANFCAGLDLAAVAAAQAAGILPPKDPDFINPLGLRPPTRTKPVVVAVHGLTQSVGDELCLYADIRVAERDTVFGQLEVTLGVFPAGGATVRLMLWDADEALRLGLVQAVTPPGKQLDRAIEIATKIAAAAPLGVRATLASAHQAISGEDAAMLALQPTFGKNPPKRRCQRGWPRRAGTPCARAQGPMRAQGILPPTSPRVRGEEEAGQSNRLGV
jgi:enoyl-CoA hydratase